MKKGFVPVSKELCKEKQQIATDGLFFINAESPQRATVKEGELCLEKARKSDPPFSRVK